MVFSYLPLVSGKEKAADSSYPSSYALSPEPAPPTPRKIPLPLWPKCTASAEASSALSSPPDAPAVTPPCACLCLP